MKLSQGIFEVCYLSSLNQYIYSACELDNQVADELDAMEQNAVLPKRWNGLSEQEHLNTQHWAWSCGKQKDHDDKLTHHDEFMAELQMLSSQQAESLKLDKLLQAQIQMLWETQISDWKEESKVLQQQI